MINIDLVAEFKSTYKAGDKHLRQNDGSTLECKQHFLLHHVHNLCRELLHLVLEEKRCQRNTPKEQLMGTLNDQTGSRNQTRRHFDLEGIIVNPELDIWDEVQPHRKPSASYEISEH